MARIHSENGGRKKWSRCDEGKGEIMTKDEIEQQKSLAPKRAMAGGMEWITVMF